LNFPYAGDQGYFKIGVRLSSKNLPPIKSAMIAKRCANFFPTLY